ncbi:MAG: beta-hydroxyacyl-ACP dehydratase [Oceanococcus sp.]|nr:MAG: beta-hydroxyacyl-ACP dehydratase [Oceanococcus sp.]
MAEQLKQPKPWQDILDTVPQREPFRFIDEIQELSENHIVANYRFPDDADFYRGHFPGNPVTPGVILIETLAQAGVVALGIYIIQQKYSLDEARKTISMFTEAEVEFTGMVKPGQRVIVRAEKIFYRHRKIRAKAEMFLDDGTPVCSGVLSGMGVAA